MKPASPVKKKFEEKDDLKYRFGVIMREDQKLDEDGEPLQSLNNNMCFTNSSFKQ